ncbi:hypothetical protein [Antrihabitans stalactiti]|uniref:Uncharacterized protein n=1 Tax=Antrihabitans stalactiti TaxID=2584121 RepID=A0A848KI57_9NOCA|nr:hypothetical protein [Antrihabitans stalactiti]NMN97841.1 hypothetical protein [Antrihabitans stalactiti]
MSDNACLDYEVKIHLEQDTDDPVLSPDTDTISEDVHYLLILAGVLHILDQPTWPRHGVGDAIKVMYSITCPFRVDPSDRSPCEAVLRATSESSGKEYYTLVGLAERLVDLHLEFEGLELVAAGEIVLARYAHHHPEVWVDYLDRALTTLLRIRSIRAFKVMTVSTELGDFGLLPFGSHNSDEPIVAAAKGGTPSGDLFDVMDGLAADDAAAAGQLPSTRDLGQPALWAEPRTNDITTDPRWM